MGLFRIEIDAIGGHGCDRKTQPSVSLNYCGKKNCPDCMSRRLMWELQKQGCSIDKATFTHWPDAPKPIVDDLKAGIRRSGSFQDQ